MLATTIVAFAFADAPARAQRDQPADGTARTDRMRDMEASRSALETVLRRADETRRDIDRLSAEHAKLRDELVQAANDVQLTEARLTTTEERLADLTAREITARKALAGRHAELARLLAAMQRMGRNPPPVIITERKDVLEMIRSAKLLARVVPELNEKASALAGELRTVERLAGDARSERDRLRNETTRLNDSRTRLAGLIEANRKAAADRTRDLAAIQRESETIQRSVTELGELIRRHDQLVQSRTKIAEYEAELQRQRAAEAADAARRAAAATPSANSDATRPVDPSQATPPASAGPGENTVVALNVPRPPADNPVRPIVLAPGSGRAIGNPGRLKPEIPFHRATGRLPLPASGRRVIQFGEQTQFGSRSPGIVISTRAGAQITSPSDGWVLFAGPFRSYGQLLILNVGDGYHILLTGLSRIDVQVGQFLLAGEPVGAMSTVVARTDSGGEGSVLYVEFRKDGKPIDPSPWWAEGQQKVQG